MISRTNIPYTLKHCILETIKHTTIHPEFPNALLNKNKSHAKNKNETEFWDYKEDIDFDKAEDLAKLATRILGFHNSQGGCIIFGIKDNYVVSGFYKYKAKDSVTLRNMLKRYLGNSVNIFQDQISIAKSSKIIYLIFVPKRQGPPIPVHSNGPEIRGVPIIKKDDYYIRIGDETKVCREPADYERLFLDASFKHINAYQFEINKPFFRLLLPHHRRLIGREEMISAVIASLNTRHFIISLDGVGGSGKSALAIETLRKIYGNGDNCRYQFIVSISAKNKVWHDKIETREAGFSGLAELIENIANVFDIDTVGKTIEELKSELIGLMSGTPGILFLDNIEEINDNEVWKFLKDDVPEPVKILVTSRTKRDIGARSIPVPQMKITDARSLLYEELESFSYYQYIDEEEEVDEILEASGYLPLAIKWAASMINHCKSLKEASSKFRKNSTTKKEFLHFCFSTMFDSLTETARSCSLCIPFLSENANSHNISILLEKPIDEISEAMNELEDKGLIFFHGESDKMGFFVQPLTIDYLAERLNQDGNFKKKLINISAANEGIRLPKAQQIEVYYQSASILEKKGENLQKALQLVNAALQTITKEGVEVSPKILHGLKFLDGKIAYHLKEYTKGIARMTMSISKENENYLSADDIIFYVQSIFDHGTIKDENVYHLFARYFSKSSLTTKELMEKYMFRIKRNDNQETLYILLKNLNTPNHAYWFTEMMWIEINDMQSALMMGDDLLNALKLASLYSDIGKIGKDKIVNKLYELKGIFKNMS